MRAGRNGRSTTERQCETSIILVLGTILIYSRTSYDQEIIMKTPWAPYLVWLTISLATTMPILGGCGQDGSLYLPDKEQSDDQNDQ